MDQVGNVYLADTFNNRIRKISIGGTITTIAGIGPSGPGSDAGDGGPALSASLDSATFSHSTTSAKIFSLAKPVGSREITTDGVIHTFAGGTLRVLGRWRACRQRPDRQHRWNRNR